MLVQREEIEAISKVLLRRGCLRWLVMCEDGKLKRDHEGITKIHGVGGAMLALLGPRQDQRPLDSLNAALKKGRPGSKGIGSYLVGADLDEQKDRTAFASEGAWRLYEKAKQPVAELVPPGSISPVLPGLRTVSNRWDWPLFHANNIRHDWAVHAPIFSDKSDLRFRNAARQSIRDLFEQGGAKKRGGFGGRYAKTAGTEEARAVHVSWDDLAEGEPQTGLAYEQPGSVEHIAQVASTAIGPKAALYFKEFGASGRDPKRRSQSGRHLRRHGATIPAADARASSLVSLKSSSTPKSRFRFFAQFPPYLCGG